MTRKISLIVLSVAMVALGLAVLMSPDATIGVVTLMAVLIGIFFIVEDMISFIRGRQE